MKPPVVVGTGLVAMDVVLRGAANQPVRSCTGGTCGNVLTILAYLGWRSVPAARLALDHAGALVEKDLTTWSVDVDFLHLGPERPTPIVVQRLLKGRNGEAVHKFSWSCPCCGSWLPRYTPVSKAAASEVVAQVPKASVFFFDRPSPGAIAMATAYAAAGALIVFEPSANGDPRAFDAALALADVVKYSDQRLAALPRHSVGRRVLEIQTLGQDGLRFRFSGGSRAAAWKVLPAIGIAQTVDSAGAGDWSTAGLLHEIATKGRDGFASCASETIEAGLQYGQALAAWNCGFEGARGGMYERTKRQFRSDVATILKGVKTVKAVPQLPATNPQLAQICPACPDAKPSASRTRRQQMLSSRTVA